MTVSNMSSSFSILRNPILIFIVARVSLACILSSVCYISFPNDSNSERSEIESQCSNLIAMKLFSDAACYLFTVLIVFVLFHFVFFLLRSFFIWFDAILFVLTFWVIRVQLRYSLPMPVFWSVFTKFSSRSFKVWSFALRSMTHFYLIFV
jgi:hypothetical protein